MPMTIVVTNNVAPRFRGFLASVMLEIAPGVYTNPRMSKAIRSRVWTVMEDWYSAVYEDAVGIAENASIIMTWQDKTAAGGQAILTKGVPQKTLIDFEGVLLAKREIAEINTTK